MATARPAPVSSGAYREWNIANGELISHNERVSRLLQVLVHLAQTVEILCVRVANQRDIPSCWCGPRNLIDHVVICRPCCRAPSVLRWVSTLRAATKTGVDHKHTGHTIFTKTRSEVATVQRPVHPHRTLGQGLWCPTVQLRAVLGRQKSDDCVALPNYAGAVFLFHTQCGNLLVRVHVCVSDQVPARSVKQSMLQEQTRPVNNSMSAGRERTPECQRFRRLRLMTPATRSSPQDVQRRARASTADRVPPVSTGPSECCCY